MKGIKGGALYMNKKFILGLFVLGLSILAGSCQNNSNENVSEINISEQDREEVNAMQGETIASDGSVIYMLGNAEGIVYQVDLKNKELRPNCAELLCNHEGLDCSAKLPISEFAVYALRRNGDKVYVLGNRIFEIGENSKKEVGHGGYGNYGNQIIFDNYIAYFEKEDEVIVEDLETGKEIQRYENVTGYTQGNFYHDGYLYYITAELQLVRLNLENGTREILEEKGTTRASVYNDNIYYVAISENMETNHLVRLNPTSLEKEELIEGVFYYNLMGNKIYYSTYPGRQLFCSDINGNNAKQMVTDENIDMGFIWAFSQSDKLLLGGADCYTYYTADEKSNANFEGVILRPR